MLETLTLSLEAEGFAIMTALSGIARAQQAQEVVIGALYPMSGANAQIGVDAQHAFETALDIINKSHDFDLPLAKTAGLPGLGGSKVRIVYADHQSDPQKGRAEAERIITQDKVSALIGTYQSAVAATVSQTAERYQVPLMSADNSSPSLHRRGLKYFFRAAAHDEFFTLAMFDLLDSIRKKGETEWRKGLPLARLQNERTYAPEAVFDLVSPNMFAGSILDLDPGTTYEARFVISDPDGVKLEYVCTVPIP